VLLVGTYKPLLKALKQGLEEEDYRVDVVDHGHEGNGQLPAADYDVIVLDLRRQEASDLSQLQRWRREGLTAPVLALTVPGHTDAEPLTPGIDDCLTKPFHLDDLLTRLRALTERDK
jgi:DNA-binding response OmpR family regulator